MSITELQQKSKKRKHAFTINIPSDWEVRELGQLFDFKNGINASKESYGNGVKFINVMEVIYHNCITADMIPGSVKISDKQANEFIIKRGDVLFNRTSETLDEIGLAAVYLDDEKVVFGGFVIRGVPKDNALNDEFKKYCFHSRFVRNQIVKGGQGAIRSNIGQGDLEKVKLPFPPLSEQKVISNVLSLIDTAINRNNSLITKKELQKKWLLKNLLTGNRKLNGFEKKKWKEVKLGKLFSEIKNINDGDNIHSIMTISSKQGLISQQDKFDRVIAGDSLKKYTQICKGDFAYNKGNSKTYQMGCVYQLEEMQSALVPFVYICFSPSDSIDSKFYKHWFLAHGLDRQLKKIITSGARGDGLLNVNVDDFFNLKIVFPSKEEQSAIAKVLQATDKEIQILKSRTEKLWEKKKWLMQVLLTGEKRLRV